MIYLRTGQPGAGKTLLTLHEVRERAIKENRTVYYHGIEILKPDEFPGWELLEKPEDWHKLPDGAIIVHDECQTLYRPRGTGAQVPEHVAKFETHRHKGHDVYLITQHPMLVDSNIRRLTGEHSHVVRTFGANAATVHRWGQVKEQCDKARSDSERTTVAYPVGLFGAYKSATIHTHKRRIPKALIFVIVAPLLVLAMAGGAVWWFKAHYMGDEASVVTEPAVPSHRPAVAQQQADSSGPRVKPLGEWVSEQQPRIAGLPHTAPIYDEITKPVRAPAPAACVQWEGKGCRCYTEQGTRIDAPEGLCSQIVKAGYYVAWDQERNDRTKDRNTKVSHAER